MNRATWLLLLSPLLALFACESATNLDVSYRADAGGSDAFADADPDSEAGTGDLNVLEACPCDPALGLGCCVTSQGAFCTNDHGTCVDAKGEWLRCAKRDMVFESECCWQGSGVGAQTRWASACNDGPTACLTDSDCAGTGQSKCSTATCSGFTFGQCAAEAPKCPTNP